MSEQTTPEIGPDGLPLDTLQLARAVRIAPETTEPSPEREAYDLGWHFRSLGHEESLDVYADRPDLRAAFLEGWRDAEAWEVERLEPPNDPPGEPG